MSNFYFICTRFFNVVETVKFVLQQKQLSLKVMDVVSKIRPVLFPANIWISEPI